MQIKQILKQTIFTLVILTTISSCMVETAKAPAKQYVNVYTDCLKKSDIKLFASFSKKEHIIVRIIHLPTDTILLQIKNEKYNTNADLIILKSLFSIHKAQQEDLLQPVSSWKMDELIDSKFKSKNNTWFGIGIDPYVFVAKNDSLSTISEFGELFNKSNMDKWSTNFETANDLVPMLAPILQKKKRNEAKEWYLDFLDNQHSQSVTKNNKNIPIITANVLLTNYSTYIKMMEKKDSTNRKFNLQFSNQKKTGSYYDLRCAGIIKQARNYENAKLLLEFISTAHMNEKLNNCWHTFPISLNSRNHPYKYQNISFKLYKGSSSKILINYINLSNIIKKSRKRLILERDKEDV